MKVLSSTLQSLFYTADHAGVVAFVELQLAIATQRFCTAGHDMTWGGQTWLGVGALASIEPIKETEALEATGLRMSLAAVSEDMVNIALTEHMQGKPAKVWIGGIDANGLLVADPVLEFQGRVDGMIINESQGTASIGVTVESRLADFEREPGGRYTHAEQQKRYPGDAFFSHIAAMTEKELVWPAKSFFQ